MTWTNLLATPPDPTFFAQPAGWKLWLAIAITVIIGFLGVFALTQTPSNLRRGVIWIFTFVAGLFWATWFFWPKAIGRDDGELPRHAGEKVAFWLTDTTQIASAIAQTLGGMLLGLGIYSLLRVHSRRLFRLQKDWFFSAVLIASSSLASSACQAQAPPGAIANALLSPAC